MDQNRFYCQQCRQMKLFQRPEMSHTPHILATVFLCGLWLPFWIITTLTYNPPWRCSYCGFTDSMKYLLNPDLRLIESQRAAERASAAYHSQQTQIASARSPIYLWWLRMNEQTKRLIFIGGAISLAIFVVIGGLGISSMVRTETNRIAATNIAPKNIEDQNAMANRRAFIGALRNKFAKTMPTIEFNVGGASNEIIYVNDSKITAKWVDTFWQADNVIEMRKMGFKNVVISAGKEKKWERPL